MEFLPGPRILRIHVIKKLLSIFRIEIPLSSYNYPAYNPLRLPINLIATNLLIGIFSKYNC